MIKNDYDFFSDESKKYKKILLDYKNKSKVFEDANFLPKNCKSDILNILKESKMNMTNKSIEWKRIDDVYHTPLFNVSKIKPKFVNQGHIGDCYFITALSRIAKKGEMVQTFFEKQLPDDILGKIPDSLNIKCGAVVIYFRVFGRRTPVLIDTLIPFIKDHSNPFGGPNPVFSTVINPDNSPWFLLVEKAFAKLNGSYSNIIGGFFADSFYHLYGYYKKSYDIIPGEMTKNAYKILQYQYHGCLMDASIDTDDKVELDTLKKLNLHTTHSYLLIKARKYKDRLFFQLRNPWGCGEFITDYTKDDPELSKYLTENKINGFFWIDDKDFFKHFTNLSVAKPVDPFWFMQYFSFELEPTKVIGMPQLNQHRNFTFQLLQDVPSDKKARVRILVEKRNKDYEKLRLKWSYVRIYVKRNGGKKLTNDCNKSRSSRGVLTYSTKVTSKSDIITFAIVHDTDEMIESNCYVNVFCEFDFKLTEIGNPNTVFEKGISSGPVLDNFSISEPNAALVLKRRSLNGRDITCLRNMTISDLLNEVKDTNEIIVKNLIKEARTPQIQGKQINLSKYIFAHDPLDYGPINDVFRITNVETGKQYATMIDKVYENFSEKVSIVMKLKHPSIANFIGFNETGFSKYPYPLLIADLYTEGTLSSKLEDYFGGLNNTKKMINLIGIAFGMKYIHEQGIILRDLRCSSILLDDNLYPKITNFRTARFDVPNNKKFAILPPFYFFAPEMMDEDKQYSFKADVFAYGLLYYHVIFNEEPKIDYISEAHFNNQIRHGKLPSLDNKPNKFIGFIQSMWSEDPNDRPSFDQIIETFLDESKRYDCWLDDVDEKEVERYINQFGATLKK